MSDSSSSPVSQPHSADELSAVIARLREAGQVLARQLLDALLDRLDALSGLWQPGSAYHERACELLAGVFCPHIVRAALQGLAFSLTRPVLMAEVRRELGRIDLMDAWQGDEAGVGFVRGFPHGVVAQVLAGNVFLGGVIGLAQCLLTRNAALLKLSRQDSGFTALFVQSLRDADPEGFLAPAVAVCAWDSQQEALNDVVRAEADVVVVWGGAAAVAAYPPERCRGPVIHYGPRLGVGLVLGGVDLAPALPALAWDVAAWEQRACSSPRLLLVEDADRSGTWPRRVAAGLSAALYAVRSSLPPQPLTLDDKAEVLSLRELAWWTGRAEVLAHPVVMDHTVLVTPNIPDEIPIGHRTVVVVPIQDVKDLPTRLAPLRAALQTAVLAAPAPRWREAVSLLARAGLTQVAAAGAAAARFLGLPHEGDYALRRLVRLVGVDLGAGPLTYAGRAEAELRAIAAALAPR